MTANINMRTVMEGVCQDVQAQLEQNRADTLRREEEIQHKVDQIAEQLQKLTTQLNEFVLQVNRMCVQCKNRFLNSFSIVWICSLNEWI